MLEHVLGDQDFPDDLEALMIEMLPGSFIPFFIEEIDPINEEEAILKLEEYNDRNAAAAIVHKNVYAPAGTKIQIQKEQHLDDLLQAELSDQHGRAVGKIDDYFMNGKQVLLQVHCEGKEHLIPFSEELIIHYNPQAHQLTLQIADGLLDL